jgi:Ala-tRNA(Pro) deacylase
MKGLPLLALKSTAGRTQIVIEGSAMASSFVRALPPLLRSGSRLSVSSEVSGFDHNELFDDALKEKVVPKCMAGPNPLSMVVSSSSQRTTLVAPPPKGHADQLYAALLGMIEQANMGGAIFSLDASKHRIVNGATAGHLKEMVDTGVLCSLETCLQEGMAHFDAQLLACMEALIMHKDIFAHHGVTIDLHPPVFTCEQAHELCQETPNALSLKNLFMTDKKKKQKYLMTAIADTQTGFKPMGAAVEAAAPSMKPKGGLSFASHTDLKGNLGLLPGSVSPLGLLNDNGGVVAFFLDQRIFAQEEVAFVSCHPNACNASVTMHRNDLVKFLQTATGHTVTIIPMDGSASDELTADEILSRAKTAAE